MVEALLKPKDVARLLGIGPSTVYRLAGRGLLPFITVPGTNSVRFRPERIRTLLLQWERNGKSRRRRRPGQGAAQPVP